MNSTFRQLRLFLALADEGSVSRAAQACHVTQPTASMQLKEIALSVGLPLYEVIGKKIYLKTNDISLNCKPFGIKSIMIKSKNTNRNNKS